MKPLHRLCLLGAGLVLSASAVALEVKLTAEREYVDVLHQGKMVRVQRIQDPENLVSAAWGKTSRNCPPFCIHPMSAAPGVQTAGEIEVLEFMEKQVNRGTGVLIDARLPSWFRRGTIPGSVNIPFTVFEKGPTDPETAAALRQLGGIPRSDVGELTRAVEKPLATLGLFAADKKTDHWDFSRAKAIMLWCNGPWCDQSPRAIQALLNLGYPKEKIHYYRGGMQLWQLLGLTTIVPD